jgi:hypothetical protein
MDFTSATYTRLLEALQSVGYAFQTVAGFFESPLCKTGLLRHDVDRLPGNALRMGRLENALGVSASYYFRAVPESWDEKIIRAIAGLGHEIGYHYENLSLCQGKYELAIRNFELNLEKLRKIYPVKTICMHGSPLSKWDNRDLWEKYDYRDFGIIGDPYFDVDFNEVFYLTDTGRRWDGEKVSVRDKVKAHPSETPSGTPSELFHGAGEAQRWPRYHSTFDIIEAVKAGKFPDKVMMTVHPQRWHDRPWPWVKELIWQNIKNVVKKAMVHRLGR